MRTEKTERLWAKLGRSTHCRARACALRAKGLRHASVTTAAQLQEIDANCLRVARQATRPEGGAALTEGCRPIRLLTWIASSRPQSARLSGHARQRLQGDGWIRRLGSLESCVSKRVWIDTLSPALALAQMMNDSRVVGNSAEAGAPLSADDCSVSSRLTERIERHYRLIGTTLTLRSLPSQPC